MKSIAVILIALSAGTAHASLGTGAPTPTPTPPPAPVATPTSPTASTQTTVNPDPGPHGFELGVQLGNQWPGGNLAGDTSLGDLTGGGLMIGFDIGQRVSSHFFWGWQVSQGYISAKDPSCTGGGCSLQDLRTGLLFRIYPHIANLPPVWQPYIGLGVNFDMLTASAPGATSDHVFGIECASLSIGTDFLALPNASLGAYFATSFGLYIGTDHDTIGSVAMHEWFTLGVRGAFTL